MEVRKKNWSPFTLADRLFWFLCSVKLAVIILLTLAAALAVGTILESVYDTPTAGFWVYRARWFHAVLGLLGVQIVAVALSRIPWRKRHTPFLMAHLGIVLLLIGSWITDKFGVDGMLRFSEGEIGSVVEMSQPLLVFSEGSNVKTVPVRWVPPNATFKPFEIEEYSVRVAEMISRADANVSFDPAPEGTQAPAGAAVKLRLKGGPMRLQQEFWLWSGDPGWNTLTMGPARVSIVSDEKGIAPLFS